MDFLRQRGIEADGRHGEGMDGWRGCYVVEVGGECPHLPRLLVGFGVDVCADWLAMKAPRCVKLVPVAWWRRAAIYLEPR